MKIKGYHNRFLARTISILANLTFIPLMIFTMVYLPWYQTILMFLFMWLIGKVGHMLALHRYFCHRSFETTPLKEWLLALSSTLVTSSPIISYVAAHHYHHKTSDTPDDFCSPVHLPWWKVWFLFTDENTTDKVSIRTTAYLWRKKPVRFFHDWYWPTIFVYVLILGLINPWLILTCYFIPVGYGDWMAAVGRLQLHRDGYRNFDIPDASTNNTLWNWLTLGDGLHNNHHANQLEYDWAMKPGEIDHGAWFIRKFLLKK